MGIFDLKKQLTDAVDSVRASVVEKLQNSESSSDNQSSSSHNLQNVHTDDMVIMDLKNKINELNGKLEQYSKLIDKQSKLIDQANNRIAKLEQNHSANNSNNTSDSTTATEGQLTITDIVYSLEFQQQIGAVQTGLMRELKRTVDNMCYLKDYVDNVVKVNFLNKPD